MMKIIPILIACGDKSKTDSKSGNSPLSAVQDQLNVISDQLSQFMRDQFSQLIKDQFVNMVQDQMSASNCYTEGSGAGSHGENVRASSSSAARLQSFNSQERDGYVDDSMYIPRERSFLVSMRLAILFVTHMITVVQTAAQLVLEMKRKIVCFIDIVYILNTPILYKQKVTQMYVQTMIFLDFNPSPVSHSPYYNPRHTHRVSGTKSLQIMTGKLPGLII